jgi:hypothetical protein
MLKTFIVAYVVFALLGAAGCVTNKYEIKSEKPTAPATGVYKTVFVGWLNLGRHRWKDLGFKNQAEWDTEIRAVNVEWLHKAAKSELSSSQRRRSGRHFRQHPGGKSLYREPSV